MADERQNKWSLFRFAVRNSYVNAAILTALFTVAAFVRSITTSHTPISPARTAACVAGFYLVALSLLVLRWYAYVAQTKRASRKKGW